MTSPNREAADLYALLIGINCYLPNRLPNNLYYRSLLGCVSDILYVERFMRNELGVPDERLIRLTASDAPDPLKPQPPEPPELWPTYDNIVASFRKLRDAARPGDHVYIHYSGHGGRTQTLPGHTELIPGKLIDEVLVPTDIGNSEARYLRDIELAFLLQELVEKDLLVTIVLDSCHSGSATRALEVVRGIGVVDTTPRPTRSLVATDEALAENWRRAAPRATRDFTVRSGWLPDPRGYVLLAACRANEGAYEYPFEGGENRGALTYWLLNSFEEFGLGVTYRTIYRRLYAKIHSQFPRQTPQLEGEGDRLVFGREEVKTPEVFTVMSVDEAAGQLTLNAGSIHGIRAGSRLAVFAGSRLAVFRAGADAGSRAMTALVEIVEPGATTSTARVLRMRGAGTLRQGDEAVLLAPGTDTLPRVVGLLPTPGDAPEAALAEVGRQLKRYGRRYLRQARPGEPADFNVRVNDRGEFVILDSKLDALPNLRPALNGADADATRRVVERLVHLARYLNVRELANDDPQSALVRQFSIEIVVGSPVGDVQDAGLGAHALKVGDLVTLRARNQGAAPLNITVMDLRPDWGITQVFPSRAGLFEMLDAGGELCIPLSADLPAGYEEGTDMLKVFATTEATDLKSLELPALDIAPASASHTWRTPTMRGVALKGAAGDEAHDTGAVFSKGADWAAPLLTVNLRRG
ncbi:MAG: caspase family protein [Pyrinomonadaceae bacterium]